MNFALLQKPSWTLNRLTLNGWISISRIQGKSIWIIQIWSNCNIHFATDSSISAKEKKLRIESSWANREIEAESMQRSKKMNPFHTVIVHRYGVTSFPI